MDMQLHEEDLHGGLGDELERMNSIGDPNPQFGNMEEVREGGGGGGAGGTEDGDFWLDRGTEDMLNVDDPFFYGHFPPLPDFPCVSSSSSQSSSYTPAAVHAVPCSSSSSCSTSASSSSSSSSSSTSWAIVRSDAEEGAERNDDHQQQHEQVDALRPPFLSADSMEIPPSFDVDCMDVMEEFGDMDLLDTTEMWDPSTVFPFLNPEEDQEEQQEMRQQQQQQQLLMQGDDGEERAMAQANDEEGQGKKPSDDLAKLFFEWLKSNKESISAEDLRNIKLKRSTIDCAAQRLGGGKEGMKRLLKLILEWVQNHHLQRRRMRGEDSAFPCQQTQLGFQNSNPNPNINPILSCNPISPDSTACFSPATPWIPQPPYVPEPTATGAGFPPMVGFANGGPFSQGINGYSPPTDYRMLDPSVTWPSSNFTLSPRYNSFTDHHLPTAPPTHQVFAPFANQYPCQPFQGSSDRLLRMGSSATKEARKKRMARQRRFLSHHRSLNHQQQHPSPNTDLHAKLPSEGNCANTAQTNPENWMFWSSSASVPTVSPAHLLPEAPPQSADRPPMQPQNYQRQITSDRRQGWKPEKNLRFLLQKVLKQSDVGNLGRIVLPKVVT
uniref:Uncharacterized protein n=1 Tax=Nelumbo nucifera TaxID=4432 RepID=A0A822XRS4_NELNU|nr:TPA_asm: hypothetical protein HUJ06_021631 [Nelumbo nucifera]